MDLTKTIVPRSDQLNSDDLITGPVTVTITEVRDGNTEQPVCIHLAEFPDRPYKPSKSMRRVLVEGWGSNGDAYTGRRLTLFRNPEIKFGGDKVGGIEIEAMSHIPKRFSVNLMVTRGKRKLFTVQPLPDAPAARDWKAEANTLKDVDALRALYMDAQAAGADQDTLDHIRSQAS